MKAVIAFRPDIAFVLLGTNDTCQNSRRKNWEHHGDLVNDATYLIAKLRKANPNVIVHLNSPTMMFPNQKGIKPARKKDLSARGKRLPTIAKAYATVAKNLPSVYFHDSQLLFLALRTLYSAIYSAPVG